MEINEGNYYSTPCNVIPACPKCGGQKPYVNT